MDNFLNHTLQFNEIKFFYFIKVSYTPCIVKYNERLKEIYVVKQWSRGQPHKTTKPHEQYILQKHLMVD